MIDFKHINKLLSIHPKGTTLDVLDLGIVENSQLKITDLDYKLLLNDVPLENDSIISIPEYRKNKNLIASCVDNHTKENFPDSLEKKNSETLPKDLFGDISLFTNYTSSDFSSRQILTGIYYDLKNGEMCATNGNILHKRILTSEKIQNSFVISRVYSNVIQYIHDKLDISEIKLWDKEPFTTDENEKEQILEICFDGGIIEFKCLVGQYPEYNRVIPDIDNDKLVKLSSDDKKYLLDVISTMNKYTPVTGAIYFFDNNIVACQKEDKIFYTELKNNPFKYVEIKYVNGELLKQIFSDVKEDSTIYCKPNVGPCVIYNNDDTYILMPLRYEDDIVKCVQDNFSDGIHIDIEVSKPKNKIKSKRETRNDVVDSCIDVIKNIPNYNNNDLKWSRALKYAVKTLINKKKENW